MTDDRAPPRRARGEASAPPRWRLLRNRALRRLWAAQLVAKLGD